MADNRKIKFKKIFSMKYLKNKYTIDESKYDFIDKLFAQLIKVNTKKHYNKLNYISFLIKVFYGFGYLSA